MTTIAPNAASGLKGDPDRLYTLLPQVYRQRDAESGYPLRDLLRVVAEQVEVVEDDIARLYENWFIETCDDWVVPYIGEAVGITAAPSAATDSDNVDARALARGRRLLPRAQVADGIRALRRKGTLALLQEVAHTGADWPVRAVEFYRLVGLLPHVRFPRPHQGGTASVRDGGRLAHLNTPFDSFSHTIDVRRPNSDLTPGRYNVPSLGLFLWRLRPYGVTDATARYVEGTTSGYTFSVLGNDCALFHDPSPVLRESDDDSAAISALIAAAPATLPVQITRRQLERRIKIDRNRIIGVASREFYGQNKSIAVYARDWPVKNAPQPVPAEKVLVTDLSDWRYEIPPGFVGLDPQTGRLLFSKTKARPAHVRVCYHYGFSDDMGGGEYPRYLDQPDHARRYHVSRMAPEPNLPKSGNPDASPRFAAPSDALRQWAQDRAADVARDDTPGSRPLTPVEYARKHFPAAVIEIEDSEEYVDRFAINLIPRETLIIRGADGARPVLRLLDYLTDQADGLPVTGTTGSRLTLDGLWIIGLGLVISGQAPPAETEDAPDVPSADEENPLPTASEVEDDAEGGVSEQQSPPRDLTPRFPPQGGGSGETAPLPNPIKPIGLCEVRVRHCTLVPGWGLKPNCDPLHPDYPSIKLEDTETRLVVEQSILGSIAVTVSETRQEPVSILLSDSILDATANEREALGSGSDELAYAALTVQRCTIFGQINVHAVSLGEDTLFCGNLRVARRQAGCLRFCYVPYGSRTPRRFQCQPDGVTRDLPEGSAEIEGERRRVTPQFTSMRYGSPAYAQLSRDGAEEITRGAEDESEMGAFHDLYAPQREALLRQRVADYTPEDRDAGLIFVN